MELSFTYVLYSKTHHRFYVGMTDNVYKRLAQHNAQKVRSTKAYAPWEILFFEEYKDRSAARAREVELKTGKGRDFIKDYWERSYPKPTDQEVSRRGG